MRKSLVLILLAFLITWIMQFSSIAFHCSLNHRCNFILLGGGVSLQIPTIVEFDTYVETLVTLHLHQCRLQSSCFFFSKSGNKLVASCAIWVCLAAREKLASLPSLTLSIFSLVPDLMFACGYFNTQKYGLFCSLSPILIYR